MSSLEQNETTVASVVGVPTSAPAPAPAPAPTPVSGSNAVVASDKITAGGAISGKSKPSNGSQVALQQEKPQIGAGETNNNTLDASTTFESNSTTCSQSMKKKAQQQHHHHQQQRQPFKRPSTEVKKRQVEATDCAGQSEAAPAPLAARDRVRNQDQHDDDDESTSSPLSVGPASFAAAAAAAAAAAPAAATAPATSTALKAQPQHTVIECADQPEVGGDEPAQEEANETGPRAKAEHEDSSRVIQDTGITNIACKQANSAAQTTHHKRNSSIALLPIDHSKLAGTGHLLLLAAAASCEEPEVKCTSNSNSSNNSSAISKQPQPQLQPQSGQILANSSEHQRQQQQQQQTSKLLNPEELCKQRRLSYLQSLLLRKWPCSAIAICVMSSLLFGMLLSVLTIYLMHGVTDCSGLALAAAASAAAASPSSPLLANHQRLDLPRARPNDFETPIELASLTSSSSSNSNGLRSWDGAEGTDNGLSGRLLESSSSLGPLSVAAAAVAASNNSSQDKSQFQRLPGSLWPIHYDLFVHPRIAEPFNFSGKVSIRIKCAEPTDNITLHTLDLNLDERTLSLKLAAEPNQANATQNSNTGKAVPKVKALSQNKQLQYSIIKLDGPLEVGQEYVVGIDFSGYLNEDLAGFYKIKYERQNSNETTWIAATQFQATDARRAFPCFDEPLYKATFSIQIKHWKNMTALSNMPIIDRQDSPDDLWVTDTFSKSHRMSTYLVAYAVTNFESRSEGNISVWTRPGFAHTAEYALKIAGKILRHYETFFGIEYPLPKMDMIALPDFNAGAMENWGLITYRETAMLYDENTSSIANKQRVAVVVAHELAHQWFGNLVTPKWWDDLWLNEGFASYVEYIGVDHVEPMWRMLDQFVVEEVQDVFRVDSLSSSHQISIPVNNPEEISEIFDHISYAKGASIIRMMNHFLTEDVFKSGLRTYLRALKYSNAEQKDLWAHLTEAQHRFANLSLAQAKAGPAVDVEKVMNSWTLQTGYPLVTLTREYGVKKRASLQQVRYEPYKYQVARRSVASSNSSGLVGVSAMVSNQSWEIPITYTSKYEQNWQPITRLWMHQNQTQPVELDRNVINSKTDDEWILLNINQVGYYRVNYDLRNWRLLIDQLNTNHKLISNTSRAQILDDVFELARVGLIDYQFAMEATKYLRFERDYLPWETVLMSFSYIDEMLQRTPIYGDWEDYLSDLIAPYYARYRDFEWTIRANKRPSGSNQTTDSSDNDILEQYNLVNAVAWACQVDNHCIEKAKRLFASWRTSGKNDISPPLRFTTYCTAIKNGNKDDWDFLWRIYEREQNASERDRIMRALGCTKEIWLLARYLEWTFDKTKPIRRQDGSSVFRMVARNNYGRDIAFNFMRERWHIIKEYYGKTSFSFGNLIRTVSISMNTQVELQQLLSFYENIKGDVGTGKRSFQIAIEEVETNVKWRNRNYKILEQWLREARAKMREKSNLSSHLQSARFAQAA